MAMQIQDWSNSVLSGGRYQVLERIGQGGMGQVYTAMDHNLDTKVVIKVPHAMLLQNEEFLSRFKWEIRTLVKLSHPHIVKILDVGDHEGIPFLVMQYLDGGSLEERRPRHEDGRPKKMRPSTLQQFLPQVAQALDFLHAEGFVHRDVKPANILFDRQGNAYLSDFGVVKVASELQKGDSAAMTGTGMLMGTPDYMAPELVMGEDYGGKVDQYALAIVCYELLCGEPPYAAATPAAVMVLHTVQKPPHLRSRVPRVSPRVCDIVMRGMARDPKRRFSTCEELSSTLITAAGPHADPPSRVAGIEPPIAEAISVPEAVPVKVSRPRPEPAVPVAERAEPDEAVVLPGAPASEKRKPRKTPAGSRKPATKKSQPQKPATKNSQPQKTPKKKKDDSVLLFGTEDIKGRKPIAEPPPKPEEEPETPEVQDAILISEKPTSTNESPFDTQRMKRPSGQSPKPSAEKKTEASAREAVESPPPVPPKKGQSPTAWVLFGMFFAAGVVAVLMLLMFLYG